MALTGFILTVIGTILNARKSIWGWYVWMLANGLWILVAVKTGQFWLGMQYGFLTAACVYGIWNWRREEKGDSRVAPT